MRLGPRPMPTGFSRPTWIMRTRRCGGARTVTTVTSAEPTATSWDKTGDIALELTGDVRDFANGVYTMASRIDGTSRYGLINRSGAEILAPDFDDLRLSKTDKLLTASLAGELLVRNLDGSDFLGRSIPLGRYPIIPIVTDGQLAYVDLASNRTVLLDLATDQEVARIPSSYNATHGGNPGSLWGGFYIVHVAGGGWSYYGMDGEPIRDRGGNPRVFASPRRSAGGFSEGLAPYQDPKRGLTGFIDTKGHWAIPPLYQVAWEFEHGLARVARTEEDRRDYRYLFLDHSGQVVAANH